MTHYLAFVGPTIVQEAFQEMFDPWDMQIPMESLDAFERELSLSDDVSRVSKDTSVIILFSHLFNDNPQKFAEIAAFYAPYSVVCILIPESNLNEKDYIEKTIKEAQFRESQENPDYNTNTPFYFTLYEDAQNDILNAIEDYASNPNVDQETRLFISQMLPEGSTLKDNFEDFSEDDFDTMEDELIIPPSSGDGFVIAVTSSKGGSGKSTVAISLGAYISKASIDGFQKGLREKPLKVCLVDLDVRDGQLWFLTGAQKPKTVMDILANGEPTVDNIQQAVYTDNKLQCDLIFAAKRPRAAKEIPSSFYAKLIQNLRNIYDVIILDTSVNYLDPLLEDVAYPIADKIVFVSDMGISSVLGCARWINENLHAQERGDKNIPAHKVGIVYNKALKDINMNPERLERATKGLPILSMIPSAPSLITYAANTGELAQILNSQYINQAIKRIAESVLEHETLGEVPFIPENVKKSL